MSLQWITNNSRLQNGIELINSVPTNKFNLLVKHITEVQGEEIFTKDELDKLKNSLQLNEDQIQILIQCIVHIIKQANKVVMKPTQLLKNLVDTLGMHEEKAEVFVKLWTNQIQNELGDFEDRFKLEHIAWDLNLQTASTFCNRESIPTASLKLRLQEHKTGNDNTLIVELNEEELLKLYNTFENVQVKLDNINKH